MLHIDWVKANDGSIEANICFSDVGTEIKWSSVLCKVSFGAVKGGKKGFDGFLVRFLRSGNGQLVGKVLQRGSLGRATRTSVRSKARFVDPIVDVIIDPIVCPFNLCSQSLRKEVNALILDGKYVIKCGVEHSYNFAGLNVDKVNSSAFLSTTAKDVPHC